MNEGGEGEEHLVAASDVPKGGNHCQVNQIALTEISCGWGREERRGE